MVGHLLGTVTPSQAWAILKRHARDEIAPLRLRELCRDRDRVSSLVAVYGDAGGGDHTLIVDLSRQRMTDATLNHLLCLSASQQLKDFITRVAWGQNNPRHPVQPARRNKKNAGKGEPKLHMPMFDPNNLKHFQETLKTASQQQANDDPEHAGADVMPTMHLALRVPAQKGYEMLAADGTNVLTGIHQEWHRIERLAEAVRRGQLRGGSGQMLRDIVVVGRGTAVAALQFVYSALQKDEQAVIATRFGLAPNESGGSRIRQFASLAGGQQHQSGHSAMGRRILFLTSLDPNAAAALTAELDAATTLVVSVALEGNEETGLITSALKNWLLKSLGSNGSVNRNKTESILAKHMILITGNDRVATVINKPESVYLIPEHSRCEAFTSFSAATLLPLALVFGWSLVEEFLAGGHDMDTHFVETNPRHNLPVLLALEDVWNDAFLDATCRVVMPFTQSLAGFPAFVGALEAQTCGRTPTTDTEMIGSSTIPPRNHSRPSCSSVVIDGKLDGSLDRSCYQSRKIINSELVTVVDNQVAFNAARSIGAQHGGMEAVHAAQDTLMCSFFSHADELAFGGENQPTPQLAAHSAEPAFSPAAASVSPNSQRSFFAGGSSNNDLSKGNRPSVLLICAKLDAFTCGQLVALTEHRAAVKAHIWGIDPFVRDSGSSLRRERTDGLKSELEKLFTSPPTDNATEEEDDGDDGDEKHLTFSTKTLLSHYARLRNR